MDLAHSIRPASWSSVLEGVDIVVNAAGLLRGRDLQAVHVDMPAALHAAAQKVGVGRIVLISAISARSDVATDYSQTKLAGEEQLRQSGMDWAILRPSLVYGDGSYGGTSLMRGMAGLPFFVPSPGNGDFAFTPIHVRDLAKTVRRVCEHSTFAGQMLEPVGPETFDLRQLLVAYRNWLGFGSARFLSIPMPVMRFMGRLGDVAGDGPIATNSLVQMVAGNGGDSDTFVRAIGFEPMPLERALRDRPAQVQDRWHARLFFLAPVVKLVLILLWLACAWLGLAYGGEQTALFLKGMGWPGGLAMPLQVGSSLLDLGIAALVLFDRRGRWSTSAQLAVVVGYTLTIGIGLPHLWLDPLGPLLKNLPIMALIAIHGAIADKR